MRIIYFSPHPTHDIVSDVGYSTHQREMILALRELGHDVIPVIIGGATEDELPVATKIQRPKKAVTAIKSWVPGMVWRTLKDARLMRHDKTIAGPRLRKALENNKVDLVYERSEYFLGQGSAIAAEWGVNHIYEVNAPCVEEWLQFEGRSFLTHKAEKVERQKMTNSTGFCPVSSPLGEYLKDRYSIDADRIKVIPNAINLQTVNRDLDRSAIRSNLGYEKHEIVLGFIGAMLPYHGVELLLEAFIQAFDQNKNLRLLVVGDGDLLDRLKMRTAQVGLEPMVRFTGRVKHEKVWEYMAAMDICVNPKHSWYGSPIKTFEYGAMSCAIIAPNEGNMRDVLTHDKTGWLYDGTESGLCDAILNLASNSELRARLGQAIAEKVKVQHTWKANAIRLVEFANSLK